MNLQEKNFFDALHADRKESSKFLEKPSIRGIKKSIVEKYSDQAHFIYELLQNADDARATHSEFFLYRDKLIFKHNGTKTFSISNPANEEDDSQSGNLGDINAITSIANSNKTEATIGKFGVGFKAVFKYTATPKIFDDNFTFKIENFIVPVRLNYNHADRNFGETLFEFPFDNENCPPEKAFTEIKEKLPILDFPTLFLSHLQKITFKFESQVGTYEKILIESRNFGDTSAEFLSLTKKFTETFTEQKLWLFSRQTDCGKYCVGYSADKNSLTPIDKPAYCFFSTKKETGLKFIIHAPFLLTDSRENILAGDSHNEKMIELLAELAADSLIYLRDIGLEKNIRLIDDNIFEIIPYDEKTLRKKPDQISFKPFFSAIKNKFQTEEILPSRKGYVSYKNAYWASVPRLIEIFSDEQLGEIFENKNAALVFITLGRDETSRNNPAKSNYIGDITCNYLDENKLLGNYTGNIKAAFIENQSFEWLHKFYGWLAESSGRTRSAKIKPFFLDTDNKATVAFDVHDKPQIFLPIDDGNDYRTIHPLLLENPDTKNFLIENIGIKEPSLKDEIYEKILPQYSEDFSGDDTIFFKKIFKYYNQCPGEDVTAYIDEVKKFIRVRILGGGYSKPNELYFSAQDLIEYFSAAQKDVKFLDENFYYGLIDDKDNLEKFFTKLGVAKEVRFIEKNLDDGQVRSPRAC